MRSRGRTAFVVPMAVFLLGVTSFQEQSRASESLDQVLDGVVVVKGAAGEGSGFVIGGQVLTAAHVVAGGSTVGLTFSDGSTTEGQVVDYSRELDIAVIVAPTSSPLPLQFVGRSAEVGEEVFVVGNPEGAGVSVSSGIVSALRTIDGSAYVQTDAAVNPGNSGGPLVNADGQVIGMVVSKLSDSEGVGLALAASEVKGFLSQSGPTDAASVGLSAPDLPARTIFWWALLIPVFLIAGLIALRPRPLIVVLKSSRSPKR